MKVLQLKGEELFKGELFMDYDSLSQRNGIDIYNFCLYLENLYHGTYKGTEQHWDKVYQEILSHPIQFDYVLFDQLEEKERRNNSRYIPQTDFEKLQEVIEDKKRYYEFMIPIVSKINEIRKYFNERGMCYEIVDLLDYSTRLRQIIVQDERFKTKQERVKSKQGGRINNTKINPYDDQLIEEEIETESIELDDDEEIDVERYFF